YRPQTLASMMAKSQITCSRVSTRYEEPGAYWMLQRYYEEVSSAAKRLDLSIQDQLAFGSLSVETVNVSITDDVNEGTRIIVFNRAFFSFANEVAKVTALTIPFRREGIAIAFEHSEQAVISHLNLAPHIQEIFADTILT